MAQRVLQGSLLFFALHCALPSPSFGNCALTIAVQTAIKQAQWDAPMLQPGFAKAATVLEIARQLSEQEQIASSAFDFLLQRWQLWTEYGHFSTTPLRHIPLLDSHHRLTQEARDHFSKEEIRLGLSFSEADLATLAAAIRNDPDDHLFSCLRLPFFDQPAFHFESSHAMTAVIARFRELNWLLQRTEVENDLKICVASLALNNAILRLKYGERAVRLKLDWGVAPLRSLLSDLENGVRPVGFFFPGTEVPEKADGISVNRTGFVLHDILHGVLLSKVDPRYRLLVIRLFRASKRSGVSLTKAAEEIFFESLSSLAIDGVPRGAMLHEDEPFLPLKWLEEDMAEAYPALLPILREDFEKDPQWYRAHQIPIP